MNESNARSTFHRRRRRPLSASDGVGIGLGKAACSVIITLWKVTKEGEEYRSFVEVNRMVHGSLDLVLSTIMDLAPKSSGCQLHPAVFHKHFSNSPPVDGTVRKAAEVLGFMRNMKIGLLSIFVSTTFKTTSIEPKPSPLRKGVGVAENVSPVDDSKHRTVPATIKGTKKSNKDFHNVRREKLQNAVDRHGCERGRQNHVHAEEAYRRRHRQRTHDSNRRAEHDEAPHVAPANTSSDDPTMVVVTLNKQLAHSAVVHVERRIKLPFHRLDIVASASRPSSWKHKAGIAHDGDH